MTVHESSLSSCVHSIIASKLGDEERAYNFYLNAARLDLDDYNNDTEDGLHVTSMGGSWMTVVKGFGGLRIKDDKISLNPFIPKNWNLYSFKIRFRGVLLEITVDKSKVKVTSDKAISILLFDEERAMEKNKEIEQTITH